MQNKCLEPIIKRGYFEKGDILKEDLNLIFPKENCIKNCSCMADAFWQHDTFCDFYIMEYKTLSYIKEEDDDLIEQDCPVSVKALEKFSGNEKILVFAHYSPADKFLQRWIGESAIVFLGCYRVNIEKSIEFGSVYLKLLQEKVYIDIDSSEVIYAGLYRSISALNGIDNESFKVSEYEVSFRYTTKDIVGNTFKNVEFQDKVQVFLDEKDIIEWNDLNENNERSNLWTLSHRFSKMAPALFYKIDNEVCLRINELLDEYYKDSIYREEVSKGEGLYEILDINI